MPEFGYSRVDSISVVWLLLGYGADIESTVVIDEYPYDSVWFALAKGRNATLAKLLLARGAAARGLFAAGWHEELAILRSPLLEESFDPSMLRTLVRAGASPDIEDRGGRTAREMASRKRHQAYDAVFS